MTQVQKYGNYNPKADKFRQTSKGGVLFGFEMLNDPLPYEVVDGDEIKEFFEKKNLVPYAGTTHESGHGLLSFYNWMARASATSGACITAKKLTAFGGMISIVNNYNPIFDLGDEEKEVPRAEKEKFVEMCTDRIIYGKDLHLKGLSCNIYEEWEKNGNGWLELRLFEVAGVRYAAMYSHRQAECIYEYTDSLDRVVKVSKRWDEEYLRKHPAEVIPLYPNFEKMKDGTQRTMFHISNGTNSWYGRPPSESSMLNQYKEYQNTYYLTRQAGKEFTGKLIVEVEDDQPRTNRLIDNVRDQKAGFKGTQDRFEKNFTNRSKDPSTFLLFSRPHGSRPMSVFQLKPNTEHDFYKTSDEIDEKKIIMSHSWSKNLLGTGGATGLSTNVYLDELSVKDATINFANQEMIRSIVNAALSEVKLWVNYGLEGITMKYQSPFVKILEQKKLANENSNATE